MKSEVLQNVVDQLHKEIGRSYQTRVNLEADNRDIPVRQPSARLAASPMKAPEDLAAQMADKTNDQLAEMLKRPDDWLPEALDVARAELQRRGIDTSAITVGPPPMPAGQPLFFPVSPLKLVVMSTVTLGIYELYWFYKNWKLIKQRKDSDIEPFWRAFFGVFFCYSCFKEVKEVAASRSVPFPSSPGLLAVIWIGLTLSWRLPEPYFFLNLLTPLVLVPIQSVVNRLNTVVAPNHNTNARFSGWNIFGTVVFGILLMLIIMAAILACYFPTGKQQSEQRTQESNAKLIENYQGILSNELKSVQQGATDNFSNNIKPTGDAKNDAISLWGNNLSKEIMQYVGNMNEEISALQEQDVFDTSLLTNKPGLKAEIPKRIEHQKIIKKYKDGWLPMLEATKEKFTPINISEKVKNQILQGTETSIQSNSAQAELLFGLLLKTDQAELNFLQFMVGAYDDYQFKDGTISFGSAANSQKYEELTKSIQGAMRNEETFREQHLKAAEDSIQQLRNELKK